MAFLMRVRWYLFGAALLITALVLVSLPLNVSGPLFAGLLALYFVVGFVVSRPQVWLPRLFRRMIQRIPTQNMASAETPIPISDDVPTTYPLDSEPTILANRFGPELWPVWQQIAGILVGLALMFLGQFALYRGADFRRSLLGFTLLLVGLVVFLAISNSVRLREVAAIPLPRKGQQLRIRWVWLALSIGLAIWNAYLTINGRDYTYLGEYLLLWVTSMFAFMMSVSPQKDEMLQADANPLHKWEYGLLIVLFLGAFAIRGINLNREPYLLDSDEAKLATEGASFIAQDFRISPFQPGADGHPRLYMAMIGVSTNLFGINLFGARLPSVLLGALTIPAIFLLGREIRDWQAGLVAALFVMGWSFHIEFSRLALNEPADPLFAALTFYFLLRGLRRGTASDYALCGIVMGIGQLFYIAGRLIPLIMIAYLIFIWLVEREVIKRQWHLLLIIPVAFLTITLPQNAYLLHTGAPMSASEDHSDLFNGNLRDVINRGQLGNYISSQTQASFLALLSVSDVSRWYGTSSTLMGIVGGPLLVLGVYISLIIVWKRPKWSLPLGWAFTVIVLGSTFAINPPFYERYVAATPAFALLVEIGIAVVALAIARAIQRPDISRTIAVGIGMLALLGNLAFYLGVYIPEGQYLNLLSNWLSNRQGNQMVEEYNQGRQVVLVAKFDSYIQNTLPVQFLMTGKPYYSGEGDLPTILAHVDLTKPTSFLIPPQRKSDLDMLIHLFPSGKTLVISLDENKELAFYLFRLGSSPTSR